MGWCSCWRYSAAAAPPGGRPLCRRYLPHGVRSLRWDISRSRPNSCFPPPVFCSRVCFPRFSCCWCCWAAAAAGQEALGRAAFVSLFLFLIAVLLLTLGVLPQATALNLRLPEEDLSRLGEEILSILPRQIEPLLLLLFAQRCSRPRSAALLLWVPAGWLLGGLLLLLAALVLGHYGSLQPYPMMQLARSAGLSGMVPVYCFLLITAAFFRLIGLAVAAARLGGMAGCRPKCSLWAGVALSLGGVALLHYTGWPDAAVYPILAVTGLLWLIFALLPPRGTGNKRDRRR